MIIALTGEKLAGKTTAADYFVHAHKASSYRFSAPLTDILKRLHQENSRANLVQIGTVLRTVFGDDMLARVLYKDLQNNNLNELHIVDGMRYMAEYEVLRSLPDFTLVYITASLEERYNRIKDRVEKADEVNMSFNEFSRRESDATEAGIVDLSKIASHIIENNSSLEDFYAKLEELL